MAETPERPVLIAYDGSPHARAAIAAAADLAAGRQAVVATVWTSFEEEAAAAVLAIPAGVAREAAQKLDTAQRDKAEELAAEGVDLAIDAGLDARPAALRGASTAIALCRLADELDAAAIVVGARGRSALAAAFLGSTSNALIQTAGRPVLVTHGGG